MLLVNQKENALRKRLCCGAATVVLLHTFVANGWSQSPRRASPASTKKSASTATRDYRAGDVFLEKSRVYVFVGKTGFGHEHAIVGNLKEGELHLTGDQVGGRVVFDMNSFDADSDLARKYVGLEGTTDESTRKQVNKNMLGEAVLHVAKYPTAEWTIESVEKLSEDSRGGLAQVQMKGQFTLHGTTRPITVIAEAEQKKQWTHLRGSFQILQSDYGITPFKKAFGAVGVTDQLTIWGDLWVAGLLE